MPAWNAWYHVTANTYGTWLPGDPRGWRTRHARPQPAADPPRIDRPSLHAHAERLLTGPPVRLSPESRRIALDSILAALRHHTIEAIACAVDDHHVHALARFPDHRPRHWFGIAKKESARALSRAGLAAAGGVWATRSHCQPIRDRAHQLDAYRYIASHTQHGVALWLITRGGWH